MKTLIILILFLTLSWSKDTTFKLDMEVEDLLDVVKVSKFKGVCESFIALTALALSLDDGSDEQMVLIKYWDKVARSRGLSLTTFGMACDENRVKYAIYYGVSDRAEKVLDKDNKLD